MTSTPTTDPPEHDPEATQVRMSFGEHLDELRQCVIRAGTGAVVGIGICIYFMYDIFNFISRPYIFAAQKAGVPPIFNTLKPQEAFMTLITLSVEVGLILTSPWIIWQAWKFIGAGLFPKERKIVYRYIGPSAILFLLGVAFFYFIVLPLTLNFFLTFTKHSAGGTIPVPNTWERFILGLKDPGPAATAPSPTTAPTTTSTAPATGAAPPVAILPTTLPALNGDPPAPPSGQAYFYLDKSTGRIKVRVGKDPATGVDGQIYTLMVAEQDSLFTNQWRASDYLAFVAFSSLIFGLAFEMPMVILILAQIGIVEVQTFRNSRKYAYFGILIAAVMVAPTGDPLTLLLLFLPLVALYELGIVLAALVVRRQETAD